MATAFGGTAFPPCPANDFSCALKGTLAFTVEPGEKGTPANVNEPAIAATEPAGSSRNTPTAENNRALVPQTCLEAGRIMLFRTQKNVRNRTLKSNLD